MEPNELMADLKVLQAQVDKAGLKCGKVKVMYRDDTYRIVWDAGRIGGNWDIGTTFEKAQSELPTALVQIAEKVALWGEYA